MKKNVHFLVALFFVLLPAIFFYKYFFFQKVPFSGNLLVSFYSPWKQEKFVGFEGGIPNKPIGFDNLRIFYPNIKFTIDEIREGRLPTWNPYIFSGNSHIGMFQTAIFYPLNVIYFLLPTIDAWSVLVILQPFASALFMFLFLRSLKLSRGASLFGSLVFAYSGWMICWWEESLVIEHTLMWLPLALCATNNIWDRKHWVQSELLLFISIVCSLLAGFFQMAIYVIGTVFLWHMYQVWIRRKDEHSLVTSFVGLGILILSIGVTAVQWLPAYQSFLLSPRQFVDAKFLYDSYLMPWQHLLTFFVPDFWGNPGSYNYFFPKAFYHEKVIYIGLVPILLVLTTLFAKGDIKKRFWIVAAIISLAFGFQLPTSWLPYIVHIPVLGSAQPSRIFSIAAFALSVLAAYGFVDAFSNKKNIQKITIGVLGIVAVLLIFLLGAVYFIKYIDQTCLPNVMTPICGSRFLAMAHNFHTMLYLGNSTKSIQMQTAVSIRNLLLPLGFVGGIWLVFIFKNRFLRTAQYALILITLASSFYFAQKFLYFSERQFVFPKTDLIAKLQEVSGVGRVWGYGNAYVENNLLSYFGIYTPEGYAPFFSSDYAKLLNTIRTSGVWSEDVNRADVDLSPLSEKDKLTDYPHRLKIMQLVGVSTIIESKKGEDKEKLSEDERFPKPFFSLVWENDTWRLWKYVHSVPRIHFVTKYIVQSDKQKALNIIFDPNFSVIDTVILEKNPFAEGQSKTIDASKTEVVTYKPSEIEVHVTTPEQGILYVSDVFDADWNAWVDNKKVEILRTNIAFRGIPVTAGTHTIRLSYEPIAVRWGIGISVLSFVVVLLLFTRKRK